MTGAFTVGWTSMSEGTADDYVRLDRLYREHTHGTLVKNLVATFRLLEGPTLGYQIDRAPSQPPVGHSSAPQRRANRVCRRRAAP